MIKKGYWRAGHAASGEDRSVAEFRVGGCARTEAALVFNSPCKDTFHIRIWVYCEIWGYYDTRSTSSSLSERETYSLPSQLGFEL